MIFVFKFLDCKNRGFQILTELHVLFKSLYSWTYYMTPFQSQTKMIYGLNQIVIPYGMIEWTTNNEDSFNYISLATLGNIIALQIVHYFDELGNINFVLTFLDSVYFFV